MDTNEIEEIEENREEIENNREEIEPTIKITEQPKIEVLKKKKGKKKTSARQMKALEKARRTKELKKMLKKQQKETKKQEEQQLEQVEQQDTMITSFTRHLPMLVISVSILAGGYYLTKSMKSKMNSLQTKIEQTETNYNPKELIENLMDFQPQQNEKLEQSSNEDIQNSTKPTKLQLNF
tara:strand:- start:859 stop:1398 length:540 start_codon:yes stop_codon:yes gene_type:complete